MTKEYYSVKDLAREFGIHPVTLYRLISNKEITATKIGDQWRVHKDDVKIYVERNKTKQRDSSCE